MASIVFGGCHICCVYNAFLSVRTTETQFGVFAYCISLMHLFQKVINGFGIFHVVCVYNKSSLLLCSSVSRFVCFDFLCCCFFHIFSFCYIICLVSTASCSHLFDATITGGIPWKRTRTKNELRVFAHFISSF